VNCSCSVGFGCDSGDGGGGKVEVENNQLTQTATAPRLAGLTKLPGLKGETAGKGDGVIVDRRRNLILRSSQVRW
jgi:hypothetical protein